MDTYNNGNNFPNDNVPNRVSNNTPNGSFPNNGVPGGTPPVQPPQWNQPPFPNQFQPPQQPPQKDNGGFAIASLITGILGFLLNFCCLVYITPVLGILALVFGIISMKSSKKGMAIVGIILGVLGFVTALFMLFFAFIITATEYGGDFEYFLSDFFESFFYEFFHYRY